MNPSRTQELLDNDIETRLVRTHQVKKALLKNAGLSDKVYFNKNIIFLISAENYLKVIIKNFR